MYGSRRCSRKLRSLSSKKPESALRKRIFSRCPHSARASLRNLHATAGSAVAAAEPTVEEKVRFAQHGQQRVTFEGTLLLAITFKDGRIQVQGVALGAPRQALHLPLGQRLKQALHLAHAALAS